MSFLEKECEKCGAKTYNLNYSAEHDAYVCPACYSPEKLVNHAVYFELGDMKDPHVKKAFREWQSYWDVYANNGNYIEFEFDERDEKNVTVMNWMREMGLTTEMSYQASRNNLKILIHMEW